MRRKEEKEEEILITKIMKGKYRWEGMERDDGKEVGKKDEDGYKEAHNGKRVGVC